MPQGVIAKPPPPPICPNQLMELHELRGDDLQQLLDLLLLERLKLLQRLQLLRDDLQELSDLLQRLLSVQRLSRQSLQRCSSDALILDSVRREPRRSNRRGCSCKRRAISKNSGHVCLLG
jgi:hypothetical protein